MTCIGLTFFICISTPFLSYEYKVSRVKSADLIKVSQHYGRNIFVLLTSFISKIKLLSKWVKIAVFRRFHPWKRRHKMIKLHCCSGGVDHMLPLYWPLILYCRTTTLEHFYLKRFSLPHHWQYFTYRAAHSWKLNVTSSRRLSSIVDNTLPHPSSPSIVNSSRTTVACLWNTATVDVQRQTFRDDCSSSTWSLTLTLKPSPSLNIYLNPNPTHLY